MVDKDSKFTVNEPSPFIAAVVDELVELATDTPPEELQLLNSYPEGTLAEML